MRLIDADALLLKLKNPKGLIILDGRAALVSNEWGCLMRHKDVIAAVESAPTIDSEPARHAKWEYRKYPGGEWWCSNCAGVAYIGTKTPYCPHCGAKMYGGAEDENA